MLFGHQNNDANQPAPNQQNGVNPLAVDPATGASLPVAPEDQNFQSNGGNFGNNNGNSGFGQPQQNFGPAPGDQSAPSSFSNGPSPSSDFSAPASNDSSTPAAAPVSEQDLLNLKQQALEQLSPLVSHLDQSPEEKFRTTMMMIQSNDNQGLIKDAYEAAQAIPDDKARAQALLDIVNEINYFTQNGENQ